MATKPRLRRVKTEKEFATWYARTILYGMGIVDKDNKALVVGERRFKQILAIHRKGNNASSR